MDVQIERIGDPITYEELVEYADSLNLHSQGTPIEARDYQLDAVKYAIRIGSNSATVTNCIR